MKANLISCKICGHSPPTDDVYDLVRLDLLGKAVLSRLRVKIQMLSDQIVCII